MRLKDIEAIPVGVTGGAECCLLSVVPAIVSAMKVPARREPRFVLRTSRVKAAGEA
jgi:hypothetical protein